MLDEWTGQKIKKSYYTIRPEAEHHEKITTNNDHSSLNGQEGGREGEAQGIKILN